MTQSAILSDLVAPATLDPGQIGHVTGYATNTGNEDITVYVELINADTQAVISSSGAKYLSIYAAPYTIFDLPFTMPNQDLHWYLSLNDGTIEFDRYPVSGYTATSTIHAQSLTLSVNNYAPRLTVPVTFKARLLGAALEGVNNRQILFYVRPLGDYTWYNIAQDYTDVVDGVSGVAQDEYTFPSVGNWECLVRFLGDVTYPASDSLIVSVAVTPLPPPPPPPEFPWWIIVGVAVAGGVVYAVWHFTKKKRSAPARMG